MEQREESINLLRDVLLKCLDLFDRPQFERDPEFFSSVRSLKRCVVGMDAEFLRDLEALKQCRDHGIDVREVLIRELEADLKKDGGAA